MSDEQDPSASALGRWTARARRAARSLKDEYEAGKRGEEAAAAPIWATPAEQLDAAVRLVRAAGERVAPTSAAGTAPPDTPVAPAGAPVGVPGDEVPRAGTDLADLAGTDLAGTDLADAAAAVSSTGDAADAGAVAGALRRVDWPAVRAATADRTSEAGRAARTLAAQVDWARVQPAAQRLSAALIGAVATGQVGIAGPLGPLVARAIVDQAGFGRRVEARLEQETPAPPDLTDVIDTTAREEPG